MTENNKLLATNTVTDIIRRAQGGDHSVMPAVEQILDLAGHPIIDLAARTRDAAISAIAGEDLFLAENLRRQCESLKADIAREGASPLEMLLVDRIVVCWLALQHFELAHTNGLSNLTLDGSNFHQARLDRANRRYLSAIKALATVRRLRLPLLQLNVAEKQVNVLTQPSPPSE